MTKKQKMILRKNIRNYLPKYDLGTSLNNTLTGPYQMTLLIGQGIAEKGRLTGNQYITTARQDEQGANLSGKASSFDAAKAGNITSSVTTPIGALASSMSAAPIMAAQLTKGLAGEAGSMAPVLAASWIGAAASAGLGIKSAIDAAELFDTPAISDSEFDAMKGEQTMSGIHGVLYKQKTGVNMSDVDQIGAAKEGADIAAAANAGSGIGAGAGALGTALWATIAGVANIPVIGWFLGPLLAAVGVGLGAGAGAGATDASDEAIAQAQLVNNTIERWNTHEAAVANSQGIRELFDERLKKLHGGGDATEGNSTQAVATADKGKPPYGVTSYKFLPRMYGDVVTPNGIQKGDVNAIVGKGEVAVNLHKKTAFNINFGKSGNQENVKAHLKNSDIILSNNPEMIIPGTEELVEGGLTPAEAGRESAERIYQINKAVEKDSQHRDLHTLKFLQELADKAKLPYLLNLASITSILNYMLKDREYKNGIEHAQHGRSPYNNLPHYNLGNALLLYGLPNLGGLFSTIGNAIMYADAKNEDIAPTPQIYRSNADAQRAIQAMRSSYNANPELAAARTINRLLNYANRHNGYTAGLRMAMDQSAYANYGSLVQKILADKQNKSVALWNAKQQALANLRDADVTRQIESNKYAHEWKARAEAAKQKRVDTYGSALYNNINNWFLNIGNSITTGKMLKLYSDELDWKRGGNNNNKYPTDVPRLTFNTPDWKLTGKIQPLETLPSIEPWRLKFNAPAEPQGKIQPLLTPIKPLDVLFDQNAYFNSPLFQNDLRSLMQLIYN